MKKTYIFKTIDGLYQRAFRGSLGQRLMDKVINLKEVKNVSLGAIVIVITTKIKTREELEKLLKYNEEK